MYKQFNINRLLSVADGSDFVPQTPETLVTLDNLGIPRRNFKRTDRFLDFQNMNPEEIYRIARSSETQVNEILFSQSFIIHRFVLIFGC